MPRKSAADESQRLANNQAGTRSGPNFRGPTPCSLVQSGAITEPLDTNRRCSPRFLPYMGEPGLDAGPGYKTFPHPSYLADSLLTCPREFCPRETNKGLHQWSIEVALSSRGVSYNYDFRSSKLKFQPPETLAQAPLFHTELAHR